MTRARSRTLAAAIAVLIAAISGLALLRLRGREPASASAPAGPAAASHSRAAPTRLPIRLERSAPSAPSDSLPASFEGRVVSRANGAAVGGADLTFSRGGAAASVRAAADGSFRFEPPVEGAWLLAAVTARGFLPFAPEWGHSPVQLDARAGRHVRGIEIHLVPAAELRGRVADADGKPVAGAAVRILGAEAEAALVSIPDRFTSDARGEFGFAAPQGAVVEARKAGFAPGRAGVDLLSLLNGRVTIVLLPERERAAAPLEIAGRVVLPGGAPAAGALVVASRDRFAGSPAAQVAAGDDGAFALSGLDAGRYRVSARAEGFAPGEVRRVLAGTMDLIVQLAAGGVLRGCVSDASSGTPVAPFTVLVFARRSALWRPLERSRSVVDAAGCYALEGLPPGPAAAVVSAPGYSPSREIPVEIREGADAVADAALETGGRLTGVVRDADTRAPIEGAHLAVEGALTDAASTFPVLSEATTGPDGRFGLSGLPPRFSVLAAAAGHHGRILAGVEVPPGGEAGPVEVTLHAVASGEEPRVELVGIGIGLEVHGDVLAVTNVRPGGGAAEVGLASGDLVLRVDGRPVEDLGFGGAVDAIRGPEGTAVVLTVQRGDVTFDVRVPRRLVRG